MMTDKKFQKIADAFTDVLEDLVKFRGNEPMIARIYAMVILSPEPLTQEEIANLTGYSRSQISRYLSNLEDREMISKEPIPGSRTQLYGGDTRSFFDEFRRGIDVTERFIHSKIEVMNLILNEWKNLPEGVRKSPEGKRLKEVVSVFDAWFSSYLDLLEDFNKRFDERMRELEKDLFQLGRL